MLDLRVLFRSYDKRSGSPRDAVSQESPRKVPRLSTLARQSMFAKDGPITIGEGVTVSSPHSRRYRLCRAVVRTRASLLNESLHLHLHLRLFQHDSPRAFK